MPVEIGFHGAAGGVTGSCYRIVHAGGVLLVDCGLFQGSRTVDELNRRPFPFDPAEPAAVLLTHAHIDHAGLLPRLVAHGFGGTVFATAGTAGLLDWVLPDSGGIQEGEAERLNRRNARRGRDMVRPTYTRADAEAALEQVATVDYRAWIDVVPGVRARWWDAGHILGSASIELEIDEPGDGPLRILFSGDIGPGDRAFHPDPEAPAGVDHLILESTYGDRERAQVSEEERRELLRREVAAALERGGNLLIPAFAVERTQEILYDLDILFDTGQLPVVDVFLDSPLAIKATDVFRTHLTEINHPGTPHPFRRANLHPVETVEESKRLARLHGGAIIMAGSGMCTAGRIRHHLKNNLWKAEATVLLVGYQAPGTLGRLLLEGRERVRIHGREIAVRATIRSLEAFSGHADRDGLVAWAAARRPVAGSVFLTHGEDPARATLKAALAKAGFDADRIRLPGLDTVATLARGAVTAERTDRPRLPAEVLADIDWHNDYAETVLDLSRTLDRMPDDAARRALLARVEKAIAAARGEAG